MASVKPLRSTVREQRRLNKRKTRPKVPLYPLSAEREYRRELTRMVQYVRDLIKQNLLPKIASISAEAKQLKTDAFSDDLNQIINGLRFSTMMKYPANRRQEMALKAANDASKFNKAEFTAKVLVPNSLPIPTEEPWLEPWLESYSFVNSRLIESIPDKYLDDVQVIVNQGVLSGTQTSEIASQIQELYGVSDRKAQFLARDQISKLNGQLNRTRQEAAGVDRYIWRTSQDDSVRESHRAKEGNEYSWDNPPSDTGNPGEDYNCRCWGEPIIPDVDLGPDEED